MLARRQRRNESRMSGKLTKHQTAAGPVRISGRAAKMIAAIADGATATLAAKIGGLSERHTRRLLAKPGVRSLLSDMARDIVAQAGPMAATRLVALAKQDDSRHVALDASKHLLGIQNIRPPAASAAPLVNIHAGYIIRLKGRALTPEQLASVGPGGAVFYDDDTPSGAMPSEPAPRVIEHQPAGAEDA